jgi:ribonuclease D
VPPETRVDPWRRTSGMHRIRTRRQLAYVAELWQTRDEIARRADRAPGRILPDVAITELAIAAQPGLPAMRQIPGFQRRQARRYEMEWLEAVAAVQARSDSGLPPLHLPTEGPPQPRLWASKDPAAAARLARVRAALVTLAAKHQVPVENLLTPDHLRRLAWRPPEPLTEATVDEALARLGARPWQRQITLPVVVPLLG